MSERYVRIFSGQENMYLEGAPIVIRASALLKDTTTGKKIAQFRMQNVCKKTISYVRLAITQLDAVNDIVGETHTLEYSDLSVSNNEEFGSKTANYLPSTKVCAFHVGISHVKFKDGSIWVSDNINWKKEPDLLMVKEIEAEDTYKTAIKLFNSNRKEDIIEAKKTLESIKALKAVESDILACDDKIANIEKHDKESQEKAAKSKKVIKLSSIFGGVVTFLFLIGYFALYPLISYFVGNYGAYIKVYNIKEFTVPDGTKEIKDYAFDGCRSLESITIPDTVTTIGYDAFRHCDNLKNLHISDIEKWCNVSISDGWSAPFAASFSGNNLYLNGEIVTNLVIPDSVNVIKDKAFYHCTGITTVVMLDSVTSIGKYAFTGCKSLKEITLSTCITDIGESAFGRCENLKEITIPYGVTTIKSGTFYNCDKLERIIIPDSVTSIGRDAFENVWLYPLENVYYTGSEEDWGKIDIDEGNYQLKRYNVKIHYNYTP